MNLFKKKSLDSILSSFTKVTQDLRDLQVVNANQMGLIDAKIEALCGERGVLSEELDKAAKVEEKLIALLN
jgi:hypothetical protein